MFHKNAPHTATGFYYFTCLLYGEHISIRGEAFFYASFGFLQMRIIMYLPRGKANGVAFGSSGGKNLKL
ncbi:hypothetical protein BK121_24995 [Paenibacillus odorifer]|nr:hypothetical protein BK121_24995 [Paenibacillus odorifer]